MSSPTHAPLGPKRRQYAAGETQVYYGSAEGQYPVGPEDLYQPTDPGTLLGPQHVDLMTYPPDPRDLYTPPPEIRLPSGLFQPSDIHTASLYQSATLNAVPQSETLLHNSKIPLGLVISPHRTLADGEEAVPTVQDGVISRCRRCRAYINPTSNLWMAAEVPHLFQWSGTAEQPYARVELNHAVVDFVATAEYLRGAPHAPAYVFLLDVSQEAMRSGMFITAVRAISENLDNLPNDELRTKAGANAEFEMLVVSEIDEAYLPRAHDLLVNLSEARHSLDALLQRLPAIFADPRPSGGATGPALDTALLLLVCSHRREIVLITASVPTLGKGALDVTDGVRSHDSQREPAADKSASAFYHSFAVSCVKACVSIDMFLAGDRDRGVATLTLVPEYTSGQTFYYPAFNAAIREDAVKFAVELGRVLAMPSMLEAEMRVRCSRGISVKSMHGNFFVQGTDRSYAVELQIEETLMERIVVFQTGLLHTTSSGERRIRVLTLALPTTSAISEVFTSADVLAITTLLAKQTVQRPPCWRWRIGATSCPEGRRHVHGYMAVNKTHSRSFSYCSQQPQDAPDLGAGLFKKVCDPLATVRPSSALITVQIAIHLNTETALDVRAYTRVLLTSISAEQLIQYIYPHIYSLHNMPADVGFVGSEGTLADLPEVDTAISQRIRAIIGKIRERRGVVHYPTLCVVKDDATLIHDRMDELRLGYRQFLVKIYGK
ncbi:protein transport protein SEC24, partial [Mycena leptocephala]